MLRFMVGQIDDAGRGSLEIIVTNLEFEGDCPSERHTSNPSPSAA